MILLFGYFQWPSPRPGLGRLAVVGLLLLPAMALPSIALADRHCSFARQAAFYAREVSSEAQTAPHLLCRKKVGEAWAYLEETDAQLRICSCYLAVDTLSEWLKLHSLNEKQECSVAAKQITTFADKLLEQVETCF